MPEKVKEKNGQTRPIQGFVECATFSVAIFPFLFKPSAKVNVT